MYGHFTEGAQDAMRFASHTASEYRHECIGTIHVLLGILEDSDGAAGALREAGIEPAIIRSEARKTLPTAGRACDEDSAKAVLCTALLESRRRRHAVVATEHILRSLLADEAGPLNTILSDLGIRRGRLDRVVKARLARLPVVESCERLPVHDGILTGRMRRRSLHGMLPHSVMGRLMLGFFAACTLPMAMLGCYGMILGWMAAKNAPPLALLLTASEFFAALLVTSATALLWAIASPQWLERFAEMASKRLMLLFWLLFLTLVVSLAI